MLGSHTSRSVSWIAGFLAILGQGAAQVSPPGEPASIHDTVVNSVTNDSISHAQVYSLDNRFAAMTDDQGHFEFVVPSAEPGNGTTYLNPSMLAARKPGFLDNRGDQTFQSDSDPKELTIRLIPEAI